MISSCFQGKPFNITVIQVYAPTTDAKEAEIDQFCEDLEDLLELTHTHTHTHTQRYSIYQYWNAKVGSQKIPGVTGKFGLGEQNEAGQRLTELCQENTLVIANILFNNTRGDFPHGHLQMVNIEINILCNQGWRSYIQSAKTRIGADCSSDHQLLIQNSGLN